MREEKYLSDLLNLKDKLLLRALLILFSLISPIGIIFIFYKSEIGTLEYYEFIFFLFGISPFLLGIYLRYYFDMISSHETQLKKIESYSKEANKINDKKIKLNSIFKEKIVLFENIIQDFPEYKSDEFLQLQIKLFKEKADDMILRDNLFKNLSSDINEKSNVLIDQMKREKEFFFITSTFQFLNYFLLVFLIMISINIFLIEIPFKFFILFLYLIFILITLFDKIYDQQKNKRYLKNFAESIDGMSLNVSTMEKSLKEIEKLEKDEKIQKNISKNSSSN